MVATQHPSALRALRELRVTAPRWTVSRTLATGAAALGAVVLGAVLPATGPIFVATVALGLAGIVVLGAFALQRFEWFVRTVLLVRPAIDLTKVGGAATGSGPLATLVGGAVIVAGAVWLAALSREGRRLPLGLVSRSLLLLLLTSVPSVLGSRQPMTSALEVARTLGAVMLLVVLEQLIRSRAAALRTLVICGFAAVVPLVAGMYQAVTGSGREAAGVHRLVGSFPHPNSFGLFLTIVLLMGYPLRRYVGGRPRWALDALLIVSAIELVLTFSRGSWIVLVIGLIVIGLIADRRVLVALPVAAVAVWALVPDVQTRLADLTADDTVGGRPGNSATWRIAHIQELLAEGQGQTLFGIGPKMTGTLTEGGRSPHNDVVRVFLEYGVVGLIFYLAFLVGLVVLAVRALRRLRAGFGRGLAVGYTAVTVAFLLNSMGANLITQFALLIYVLALAAVVQAWIRFPGTEAAPTGAVGAHGTAAQQPRAIRSREEGLPHGAP